MQKTHRRLRTDYPKGVISIYDNGGKTVDRYTVVYSPSTLDGKPLFGYLSMSAIPFYPQGGIALHNEMWFRPTRGTGEKVINFADLPEDCQKVVLRDLKFEF